LNTIGGTSLDLEAAYKVGGREGNTHGMSIGWLKWRNNGEMK